MELATTQNIFERFGRWIQESIMVKLLSIGFLMLILLIPSSWIDDIIGERQDRAVAVMAEVADKWSGSQTLTGPLLVIPYKVQEVIDRGKEGKEVREYVQNAFFLPESLQVSGKINPEILHRGIFDAVVYESALDIKSTFKAPDFKSLSIPEEMIIWKDAHLVLGISDVRGISDQFNFSAFNHTLQAEPSNNIGVIVETKGSQPSFSYDRNNAPAETFTKNGIIVRLQATSADDVTGQVAVKLKLKGSNRLDFIPAGKTTTVDLQGAWADPSFDGEFLPASREITENDFKATWKILHFNRPFSQQWIGQDQHLQSSNFGLKLIMPVDQYQKSMRTSKYSELIILLTFMALFLVEITQKIRIHPFQYILIGAALTIYYILLLSLSEHLGYNLAYGVASVATAAMITAYSRSFLKTWRLTSLFAFVLVIFYTFIFVIILQQDFSLLLGSIGLFLIVGLLMYFSRHVNWYKYSAS